MHPLDSLEIALTTKGPTGVRRAITAASLSLAEKLEFAALRWSWWRTHGEDLSTVLPGDVRTWPMLPQLESAASLVLSGRPFGATICEIPSQLHPEGWEAGAPFARFQEQFKTALVGCGTQSSAAHALVGAFHEMASNAAEHARSELPPIAAYEIGAASWAFSVTDVGRGVLGSLRQNPAFANIPDDIEALGLAVRDGVTSTGLVQRGRGFASVFKALVNRRCALRFRSIEAVATWEGTTPGADTLELACVPRRLGFHVCVSGPVR